MDYFKDLDKNYELEVKYYNGLVEKTKVRTKTYDLSKEHEELELKLPKWDSYYESENFKSSNYSKEQMINYISNVDNDEILLTLKNKKDNTKFKLSINRYLFSKNPKFEFCSDSCNLNNYFNNDIQLSVYEDNNYSIFNIETNSVKVKLYFSLESNFIKLLKNTELNYGNKEYNLYLLL